MSYVPRQPDLCTTNPPRSEQIPGPTGDSGPAGSGQVGAAGFVAAKIVDEEFCNLIKQDLLEEAAKEYDRKNTIWGAKNVFIDGAKWQAERIYNEENLYSEIESLIIMWSNDGTKTAGALTRQIMEKFKIK